MTALPKVPIQDELLAVVSIGIPVGFVTYWGSLRDGGSRVPRLAAAVVGAVVAAWLGFNVTDAGFGLFAPLVTIIGATAGANLTVLALDIQQDRAAAAAAVPRTVAQASA